MSIYVPSSPLLVPDAPSSSKFLFYDDFGQTGLPWFKTGAGTGVITRDTTWWNYGGASMKTVTSAVNAQSTEYHRFLPEIAAMRKVVTFGGMVAFADQNPSNMGLYLGWRDGTNWYRGKLLFVHATKKMQYDAGGSGGANLVDLTTRAFAIQSAYPIWHKFELTVDFDSKQYLGCKWDDLDFGSVVNRSPIRSSADATNPNVLDFAFDHNDTVTAGTFYWDHLYAYQQN